MAGRSHSVSRNSKQMSVLVQERIKNCLLVFKHPIGQTYHAFAIIGQTGRDPIPSPDKFRDVTKGELR